MAIALKVIDERPKTRGDCQAHPRLRPCPFVGCRHHMLGIDVLPDGTLEAQGMRLELDASPAAAEAFVEATAERAVNMRNSCALDLADLGEHTLGEVGDAFERTRERARQIETNALRAGLRPAVRRGLKPERGGPVRGEKPT